MTKGLVMTIPVRPKTGYIIEFVGDGSQYRCAINADGSMGEWVQTRAPIPFDEDYRVAGTNHE